MEFLNTHQRRIVASCPCANAEHLHDADWQWYEPQDIIKGIGIAKQNKFPDGFFAPYKLCSLCRTAWWRCKSVYDKS